MKQPLQLAFYKGKFGALQINFQKPHYYLKDDLKLKNFEGRFIPDTWKKDYPNVTVNDLVSREGCLFFEMTTGLGNNTYDWENKVMMAMATVDLSKMLMVLEGAEPEIKLMHDPGAKSSSAGQIKKFFGMSSPKGIKTGVLMNMSKQEGDKNLRHSVPLSGDETKLLAVYVRYVLPLILGW